MRREKGKNMQYIIIKCKKWKQKNHKVKVLSKCNLVIIWAKCNMWIMFICVKKIYKLMERDTPINLFNLVLKFTVCEWERLSEWEETILVRWLY